MKTVVDADLEQILTTIWSTLFDVGLRLESAEPSQRVEASSVTSVVQIEGSWHGAVMLRCPMALAALITSAMFQAGSEPSTDDVRDALGELANMTAGNVKALLPEPCAISLPAVAFGSDYQLSVVGTVPIAAAAFTCGGHPLVATLLHRSPDRGR